MGELVVGIDIGTSKVCTMIGKVNKAGRFEVIGTGIEPCSGVKKGIIVDVENTSESIRNSIEKAESMTGMKILSAYLNITGMHVSVIDNKTWLNVPGDNREISEDDVERLLYSVQNVPVPEDRQIIDIIPRQYIIDGYDEIVDPVGMVGVKLEVEADIIAGKITSVKNIVKSAEKAGIKIDGLVVEAIASSEVLVSQDDKEMGVILIDIGAGITDISVFKNKRLIFYDSIPVGGDHISNDISIGLKIPYAEADKLKKQYGLAMTSLIKNDQEITVTDLNDGRKKSVMVSDVVDIIEARISEIFLLSKKLIQGNSVQESIESGVILTGDGISHFNGAIQLANEVFELPVRIASYKEQTALGPEYWTAAGIIKHVSGMVKGINGGSDVQVLENRKTGNEPGLLNKIIKFFNELFFTL